MVLWPAHPRERVAVQSKTRDRDGGCAVAGRREEERAAEDALRDRRCRRPTDRPQPTHTIQTMPIRIAPPRTMRRGFPATTAAMITKGHSRTTTARFCRNMPSRGCCYSPVRSAGQAACRSRARGKTAPLPNPRRTRPARKADAAGDRTTVQKMIPRWAWTACSSRGSSHGARRGWIRDSLTQYTAAGGGLRWDTRDVFCCLCLGRRILRNVSNRRTKA